MDGALTMDGAPTMHLATPPITKASCITWRAPAVLPQQGQAEQHSLWTLPALRRANAVLLRREVESAFARHGPTHRGVRLKTDDVLVTSLDENAQMMVLTMMRCEVLPFAYAVGLAREGTHVPPLSKMFVVRYSDANPLTAKLDLHTDDLDFTVTMALSEPEEFDGGGTFFPAEGDASKSGFLLRPRMGDGCAASTHLALIACSARPLFSIIDPAPIQQFLLTPPVLLLRRFFAQALASCTAVPFHTRVARWCAGRGIFSSRSSRAGESATRCCGQPSSTRRS